MGTVLITEKGKKVPNVKLYRDFLKSFYHKQSNKAIKKQEVTEC